MYVCICVCVYTHTHFKTKQTTVPPQLLSIEYQQSSLGPHVVSSAPSDTSHAGNVGWRQSLVSISARSEVWFRIERGKW